MELTDLQKARSLTLLYKDVTSFEVTFRVESTVNRGRNFQFTGLSTVVPTCASPSPPPTSPPPPPPLPPPPSPSVKVELDAQGCVTNFDPTADYFSPEHRAMMTSTGSVPSTVTFATDFSIEYFHTFKVLRNLKTSKVYVLHQCGAGAGPPAADLPADAVGAPVFTVPVQAWSTSDTTSLGYMELLGLLNKAAVIDPSYASSACLLKLSAPGCGVVTAMAGDYNGETGAWATAARASSSTLHLTDSL